MQHNDGTRLSSGLLVSFASGVVEMNCWMKQQSNIHIQGIYGFPNWLFGCAAWGTEPTSTQQVGYAGIQEEYYLECFSFYDIYKWILYTPSEFTGIH